MKNKTILIVALNVLFTFNILFNSASANCIRINLANNPLNQVLDATREIGAAIEANKKKIHLIKVDITYSSFNLKIGKAEIYLRTKNNKIVDLNIRANIHTFGYNEEINRKITIDKLKKGKSLFFDMKGADKGMIYVTPVANFNENGGIAWLQIWNGKEFLIEKIVIIKEGQTFKIYKGVIKSSNQITGLKINIGGFPISKMYVEQYHIEKKKMMISNEFVDQKFENNSILLEKRLSIAFEL